MVYWNYFVQWRTRYVKRYSKVICCFSLMFCFQFNIVIRYLASFPTCPLARLNIYMYVATETRVVGRHLLSVIHLFIACLLRESRSYSVVAKISDRKSIQFIICVVAKMLSVSRFVLHRIIIKSTQLSLQD